MPDDTYRAALKRYYQDACPLNLIYEWLNHDTKPTKDMMHRELAFVIADDNNGEIFQRYLSYSSSERLKNDVSLNVPVRFEVGPVYTADPRNRKLFSDQAFKPLQKELVFDIDLTDYDPVRTCCKDAAICNKCWRYIVYAIEIMESALREDFGYQHILWVYSGRRGAHAWVCDAQARELSDLERRSITDYLSMDQQLKARKFQFQRPLHPHLLRSLEFLKTHFEEDILNDQDPWRTPEQAQSLLNYLRVEGALKEALEQKWGNNSMSSLARWRSVDEVARGLKKGSFNPTRLLEAKQDIVLFYMYPRLDSNVSTKLNHLLKSPFCVHPGTGRVCVPIDSKNLGAFDYSKVPRVLGEDGANQHLKDQLTSYTDVFKMFVGNLNSSTKRPVPDSELTY